MWYRLVADALLLAHFSWIIFLILGLPLGLYFKLPRLRILHAMGLILALVLQFNHLLCPLTIWEEYFRSSQYPGFSYRGSFIITYVEKLVYPGWISMNTITILTALLAGFTLLSFILRPPQLKNKRQK